MTIGELRALCVMASYDIEHADIRTTMDILRYLTPDEREQAADCYRAVIGERTLPAHIGPKHAQDVLTKPLAGRAQAIRAAQARAILEDRRNAE